MATMNDVAKAANVSIATVSHVINGTRFDGVDYRQLGAELAQAIDDAGA